MAATTDTERGSHLTRTHAVRLGVAVAAPLAAVALAYALWWVSDRLLYIGPLDRAAFGWIVVVPVWALTPVVAAYAWRPLSRRQEIMSATAVGTVVSGVAALLLWTAIAHPGCQFGPVRTPAELVLPSLLVGVVIGGGLAGICAATLAILHRARPWVAVIIGLGSGVALVFVAVLAAAPVLLGAGCQRPPV